MYRLQGCIVVAIKTLQDWSYLVGILIPVNHKGLYEGFCTVRLAQERAHLDSTLLVV